MRNDRWSNPSEIKRVLQADADKTKGGAVLYCKNGRHWKYTSEGHVIFLGVSGSGKSRRGTIPMTRSFIDAEESFIAVDPKGEIFAETAPYLTNRYKLHVIDFRHIFESECANILAAPAELFRSGDPVKKQVALEMIDDLSHTLYPVSDKADPFWPESARSVFIGAVYALMEYAEYEEINMASVYQFIAKGEERFGGPSGTYLKEFVSKLPANSIAAMMLQSYITTASDTRAGIRSTFLEGLAMFARSEGLISMMGSDDLHINQLDGETPTAIYIILPDESPIYDSICTVLISQLMGHYIRLAQDKYNGCLPRRVNFLVEEAGNVGRIGSLGHLMSAGRSRNVRCQLVLQNYSQLDVLYGSAEATTIRSNADVLVAFRTNHWDTLQELSHKCGERTVEGNGNTAHEALITPSQLAAMQTGQALVMISGSTKFISWIPDYTDVFDCNKNMVSEFKHSTTRHHRASTFDIGEFVRNGKRHQLDSLMRPSSGSSGCNPFSSAPVPSALEKAESEHESDILSGVSLDQLISDIDAKIAALEAEEAEKNAQSSPFSFVLEKMDGTKSALIKAVRDTTSVSSLKKAKDVVESLPHTFTFRSQEAADKAKRAIIEAGGVISSVGDDNTCESQSTVNSFSVILLNDGGNKVKVTKALKEATGISLQKAIDSVKDLPHPMEFTSLEEAKKVANELKKAGAEIITFNFE